MCTHSARVIISPDAIFPVLGQTPVALLRPVFLHLRDARTLTRLARDLAGILCSPSSLQITVDIIVPLYVGEVTPEMRQQFRSSLSSHLFGWDTVLAERMKLVISEFCRVSRGVADANAR